MGFWIFMFIMNLLIPLTMLIAGKYFLKGGPKEINDFCGYRTTMSMKNMETWRFAHNYCGKLWCKLGWIILIISVSVMLFVMKSGMQVVSKAGGIITGVQVVFLIGSIIPTEYALRKKFNKNGYLKVRNTKEKDGAWKMEMNRYPEEAVLSLWRKADKSVKTVEIVSREYNFDFEVDGHENIDNNIVENFFKNIGSFDNMVQEFCKNCFESGRADIKNYKVSISWITFEEDKVVIGYWGDFVNIELRAVFSMRNGIWEKEKIYYQ